MPAGDAKEPGEFPAPPRCCARWRPRGAFDELGITGYPESHHLIDDETTIQAMFEKGRMATLHRQPDLLRPGDDPAWVGACARAARRCRSGSALPGIVDNAKLLRISMRIGLGESARFLRAHRAWLRRLVTRTFTPEPLIRRLGRSGRPRRERRRLSLLHVQRAGAHRAMAAEAIERLGGVNDGVGRLLVSCTDRPGIVAALSRSCATAGRTSSSPTSTRPTPRAARSSCAPSSSSTGSRTRRRRSSGVRRRGRPSRSAWTGGCATRRTASASRSSSRATTTASPSCCGAGAAASCTPTSRS